MQQPRILARGEALLRDPATGASNLAAAGGSWCSLAPRRADERYELSGLALALAGGGLLSRLDSFGGRSGTLEVAVDGYDGYGALRDLTATAPQVLSSGDDWNAGTHGGTFADVEAGARRDGSRRVGLRGVPVRSAAGGQQATWRSEVLELRYGAAVSAVSWECWTLRDRSGATVAPPVVDLRLGQRDAAGVIAWGGYQPVADSAAVIDRGYRNFAPALAGEVAQLRVVFPYLDPGAAVEPADSVLQTATLFALCLWVDLAHSRWRFSSLAEIVERSELVRHLGPASWGDGDDLLLLRLPMSFVLRGRFGEGIRARLTGDAASSLALVEVVAQADLRFEPRAR